MVACDRPVLEESWEPCLALGGTCSPLYRAMARGPVVRKALHVLRDAGRMEAENRRGSSGDGRRGMLY